MQKIVENKIRCKLCGDVVVSEDHYDFVYCSCRSCAADGGKKYIRRLGLKANWEELSIFEEKTEMDWLKEYLEKVESILFFLMGYRMNLQKAFEEEDLEISNRYLHLLSEADSSIDALAASLYWLNDMVNEGEQTDFMKSFEKFIDKRKKW